MAYVSPVAAHIVRRKRVSKPGYRNGTGIAVETLETNGYDCGEASEPEYWSLFSWAEFMAEEPVKPKGRSRKARAPSLSLFDWALSRLEEAVIPGSCVVRTSSLNLRVSTKSGQLHCEVIE